MVFAQDMPPPGKGIFVQLPRCLRIPQPVQPPGKAVGGAERVGVVLPQDTPPPGEDVLVQFARLGVTALAQGEAESGRGPQCVLGIGTKLVLPLLVQAAGEIMAAACIAAPDQVVGSVAG